MMKERKYLIESRSPPKKEQESYKIPQMCTFMERKQEEKTISLLSLKVRKLRREEKERKRGCVRLPSLFPGENQV